MNKEQADRLVKDTELELYKRASAESVAFWAVEETTVVNDIVKEFFLGRETVEPRQHQAAIRLAGMAFRAFMTTYDVKMKPSTVLDNPHNAAFFTLHHRDRDFVRGAAKAALDRSARRSPDGQLKLPENLWSDEGIPQNIVEHIPDDDCDSSPTNPADFAGQFNEGKRKERIVDGPAMARAIADEMPRNPGNHRIIEKYIGLGKLKDVALVHEALIKAMDSLILNSPNFAELLRDLKVGFQAQRKVGAPAGFKPVLLVGPPGIGKTRLVNILSGCMGVDAKFISLSGSSDVLKLKGLSPAWGQSMPGTLARFAADTGHWNSIIVLDEIDKTGNNFRTSGGSSAVQDVLLPLLERETAGTFEDDYIQVPMDLSGMSFIATCNSLDDLPDALLSRFDIYFIEQLTRDEQTQVLNNIYESIAIEHGFTCLQEVLCQEVADAFLDMNLSPRELRREIYKAQCRAVIRHDDKKLKTDMELEDIVKPKRKEAIRQSIGFTASA